MQVLRNKKNQTKLTGLILVFCLFITASILNAYSWDYLANNKYNSDYKTSYNNYNKQPDFKLNLNFTHDFSVGLFAITARTDFLSSSLYSGKLDMWAKNGNLTQTLDSYVAPNINLSDYSGFKIDNNLTWEGFSTISQIYEPKTFTNVSISNDNITGFDMALSNMNWNVQYKASDIQYNNNLPSSMRLDTIDIVGNVFTQRMSDISYIQSQDVGRYQDLVKTWERCSNDSSKYMYRQSLDAVKSGIGPPKFLPKSFTIDTTDPQGTKNTINYLNVKWNNDRIVSFDAVVSSVERGLSQNPFSPEGREGVTLFKVSSIFQDNNKFLGLNIDVTRNNETVTHTWKTDDDISLDNFVEQIGLGVNPISIMGSNTIQLGEAKTAALSINYDDRGYLNNAVNV
ncbi:MAG: hypothetical protein ABH857_02475, partial [Elusimicrobiota bacterium]